MSTCPENDIHSVYIDGELPEAYIADYEAHIASCPECRAKLEKLKATRRMFSDSLQNDRLSSKFTSRFMDESFKRLEARMSYSKVTKKSHVLMPGLEKFTGAVKYAAAGAVAAVAVLVIMPAGQNKASRQTAQNGFEPVARTNMVLPVNQNMQMDGALDTTTLASLFADETPSSYSQTYSNQYAQPYSQPVYAQSPYAYGQTGYGQSVYSQSVYGQPYAQPPYAQTVSSRSSLASYNVFGPMPGEMIPPEQNKKGFSFHVSSPIGNISLEIGSGN